MVEGKAQLTIRGGDEDSALLVDARLILQRIGDDTGMLSSVQNPTVKLAVPKGQLPAGRYTFQCALAGKPVSFDFLLQQGELYIVLNINTSGKIVPNFGGVDAKLNKELNDLEYAAWLFDRSYATYRRAMVNDTANRLRHEKDFVSASQEWQKKRKALMENANQPLATVAAAIWPNATVWFYQKHPTQLKMLPATLPTHQPFTWNANLMEQKWLEYYQFLQFAYTPRLSRQQLIDTVPAYLPALLDVAIGQDSLSVYWQRMLGQNFAMTNFEELIEYLDVAYRANACVANRDSLLQSRLSTYLRMKKGNLAPNIQADGIDLYKDIESDTTLLVFWGTWCQHCEETLPKLYEQLKHNHKGIKVLAIALDQTIAPWQERTKSQYPAWYHVRAPAQWTDPIVTAYGINGTPSFFLLDKEKRVLGKFGSIDDFLKK